MIDTGPWKPESDPLMKTLGFERVVEYDPEAGVVGIEFRARPEQCHSGNVVQGGFVAGWIDNAMAIAAMAKSGFTAVTMSLDINVAYYRPANPGIVVARGWVERLGKRNGFTEGVLLDSEGRKIAKAMSSVAMVPFER